MSSEVLNIEIADTSLSALANLVKEIQESFNDLLEPLTEIRDTLVVAFAPNPLKDFVETMANVVTIVEGAILGIAALAAAVAGGMFVGIAIAIGAIVASIVLLVTTIIENWDTIKAKTEAIWGEIVIFFTETLPNVIEGLKIKWDEFKEFLSGLWDSISTFFSNCWNGIVTFFTETIPAAVAAIQEKFSEFGEFLSGLWESIGGFFSACWDAIVGFFTETIPKVIQDVIAWFEKLPEKIGEFISKVVTFFSELPGKLWVHLSSAVAKIGEWASGLISKVKEALPGVISSIMTFFSELPGKILEVGGNLIKGLWNGINNAVGWLMEKIRGFATQVLDGIKNIFGIHSPSAVMRDQVGKNLALGVAEGIEENSDSVINAMQDTLDALEDMEAKGPNISLGGPLKTSFQPYVCQADV